MSKSKSELSITERLIIELIQYRTSNPKHPTFYGDNENIAKCFDIQTDTARKAVNKLVKLEYLAKNFDKQGRRHLNYTGKPFTPVIANMNNIDKKLLKNDKEYFEKNFKDAKYELDMAKIRIETLERETTVLNNKLFYSDLKASKLEIFLQNLGYSKEQIESIVQKTLDSNEMPEVSQNKPIQTDSVIISTEMPKVNESKDDVTAVIADILEKFKIPSNSLVN